MTEQAQRVRQRRRGEELEAALLEAAWDELVEAGFARLTMESVAARAKTGVAVLYRRWPNKDDVVLAAIRHYGTTHPVDVPDTGSLRGDMIALLSSFSSTRVSFAAIVSAAFSGLLASSGLTPAQVREKILGDCPLQSDQVFARAHERGEIDLDRIPGRPDHAIRPDPPRHADDPPADPAGSGPRDRRRPVHAPRRHQR